MNSKTPLLLILIGCVLVSIGGCMLVDLGQDRLIDERKRGEEIGFEIGFKAGWLQASNIVYQQQMLTITRQNMNDWVEGWDAHKKAVTHSTNN